MPIGLYVHVPFCVKKCFYCDFVSYRRTPEAVRVYTAALLQEIKIFSSRLRDDEKMVDTLFLGGGTPTCLSEENLRLIISNIKMNFNLLPGAEVSVEANPGTLDIDKLTSLRNAGVNRLNIGVQACREHLLRVLGRIHDFKQAEEAVYLARRVGFENIGVDLIFGIPGQKPNEWVTCLERVVRWGVAHVATYNLQYEAGTSLWRALKKGVIERPNEEMELEMYQKGISTLTDHGYIHYEISNFAFPGYECRHNLRYWNNLPYVGLGPAAHSYFRHSRFHNEKNLSRYVRFIVAGNLPVVEMESVTVEMEMSETVFLGLRLLKGLNLTAFSEMFGRKIQEVYPEQLERLCKDGLVEIADGYLRLTGRGLPVANEVFAAFI